jgi:hypothetical protein
MFNSLALYGAAATTSEIETLPITAHLHRITARYELGKSTFEEFRFSVEVLFDIAQQEGNQHNAAKIITFLNTEKLLPDLVKAFRSKLFDIVSVKHLRYGHLREAFVAPVE